MSCGTKSSKSFLPQLQMSSPSRQLAARHEQGYRRRHRALKAMAALCCTCFVRSLAGSPATSSVEIISKEDRSRLGRARTHCDRLPSSS